MRKNIIVIIFVILILSNYALLTANNDQEIEPFFKLEMFIPYDNYMEYAQHIARYLEEINIELEIKGRDWGIIVTPSPPPSAYMRNNDLGIFSYVNTEGPDLRDLFTENGNLNMFGLNKKIPYYNESERIINQAVSTADLDISQQLYYDWQLLLIDNILPLYPLMVSRTYEAVWANTLRFESRWGIVESLPYMSFYGYHEGQESLNEFNIADANWIELNPLFSRDTSSDLIIDLITEPILQMSPDFAPLKNGLVYDWEQIDDCHYKFYLRDDVYWNPSYNVTLNRDNSTQIENSPLMYGLQGSFSNGTNQQVTAKDAVFTLLAWANPIISDISKKFEWLSNCYVDQNNNQSFHIIIDSNPQTPEKEPYTDFWSQLNKEILPEFFLNSSSNEISYTDGGIRCRGLYLEIMNTPQWISFSTSAFGCGKFMLHYSTRHSITTLKKSPYWFGVGAINGFEGMEPFVDNFKIHIIPDASAQLNRFKNGKLDWCDLTMFLEERKQMQADERFDVQTYLQYILKFMAFNLGRNFIGGQDNYIWFNDTSSENYTKALAVRKAICYSIDRIEMNDLIHDGEYLVINDILYPFFGSYYYSNKKFFGKYERDLNLAWEWMENAGYEKPKAFKTNSSLAFALIVIALVVLLKTRKRSKR